MKIKQWLWLKLLPELNDSYCGDRIPRSGIASKDVNCFSLYLLNNNRGTYLLVDWISHHRVIGRKRDITNTFSIPEGIAFEKALHHEIEILHFYGKHEFIYSNINHFLLKYWSGWDRLRAISYDFKRATFQWIFNRRSLATGDRYELLKFLVSKFSRNKFVITDIMLAKHGNYIFDRPDYRKLSLETQSLMSFLVDTDELNVNNLGEHSVTGHGWKTVNDYEDTDRRISAANKIQLGLFVLSLTVALLTAGQAGLIKFPTLWDLRSEAEKTSQEPKPPMTQINNYYQVAPAKRTEPKEKVLKKSSD